MQWLGLIRTGEQSLRAMIDPQGAGRPAVVLLRDEQRRPVAVLTIAVPAVSLQPGEILVKTWGENAPLREPALQSGLFEDTGRRIPLGDQEAQVWRVLPQDADDQ